MTESIKQWIADQALISPNARCRTAFSNGLTKGIEIAEGFAVWLDDTPYYLFGLDNWKSVDESDPDLTTSQLLDKYLESIK